MSAQPIPIDQLRQQMAVVRAQQAAPAIQAPVLSSDMTAPANPMPVLSAPVLPTAVHSQAMDDSNRLSMLNAAGSGISQIHNPFLRGLARTADIVGSVFAPRLDMAIPGTELHHNMLVNQAQNVVANDQAQAEKAAQLAQTQAVTRHTNDVANQIENPTPTYQPLITDEGIASFNPTDGTAKMLPDASGGVLGAPSKVAQPHYISNDDGSIVAIAPDANGQPKATVVYQGNPKVETEVAKLQVNGAPHTVIVNKKTGETVKDLGESGEKPPSVSINQGTWSLAEGADGKPVMFNSKTGAVQAAPDGLAKSGTFAKAQAVQQKQLAPYQGIVDEAQQAHTLAQQAEQGNAESDVALALSFFKTIRGSGGAGIRFTQQEASLIKGARNTAGDLQAAAQKVVSNGQMFTPKQRNDLLQVIDANAAAAQRHIGEVGTPAPSTAAPSGGGVKIHRDASGRITGIE